MAGSYNLWRSELLDPLPIESRHERTDDPVEICGFWRITAARTKISWPLAIWPQNDAILFKIGVGATDGASLFSSSDTERVDDFKSSTWLKCSAVTEAQYHAAMQSGRWENGQYARKMSDTEKLDIVPDTPAEQGGNMAPGEDSFREQVVTKIEVLLEKVKTLKWPFKTLGDANAAAAIVEPLRALGKQGEAKRKALKQPHMDAAAAVDAQWVILKDASATVANLVDGIAAFKRAEEARLRREAAEKEAAERDRIAEEARKEAERAGQPVDDAEVAARVEEQMAAAPAQPEPTVRVGTAQGRAISKPRTATATIIDAKALALHLIEIEDIDLKECLQKRANAAARAKITLPGTELDK